MSRQPFTRAELGDAPALFGEARIVRFQDVDAASIVFYPRVLEYFSDVYVAFCRARGLDIARALARETYGLPLAHAEADYAQPMRFGDAIDVEIARVSAGETSFRVGYRVRRADGEITATGQTVHVCIDRVAFRPLPLPEVVRKVFGP